MPVGNRPHIYSLLTAVKEDGEIFDSLCGQPAFNPVVEYEQSLAKLALRLDRTIGEILTTVSKSETRILPRSIEDAVKGVREELKSRLKGWSWEYLLEADGKARLDERVAEFYNEKQVPMLRLALALTSADGLTCPAEVKQWASKARARCLQPARLAEDPVSVFLQMQADWNTASALADHPPNFFRRAIEELRGHLYTLEKWLESNKPDGDWDTIPARHARPLRKASLRPVLRCLETLISDVKRRLDATVPILQEAGHERPEDRFRETLSVLNSLIAGYRQQGGFISPRLERLDGWARSAIEASPSWMPTDDLPMLEALLIDLLPNPVHESEPSEVRTDQLPTMFPADRALTATQEQAKGNAALETLEVSGEAPPSRTRNHTPCEQDILSTLKEIGQAMNRGPLLELMRKKGRVHGEDTVFKALRRLRGDGLLTDPGRGRKAVGFGLTEAGRNAT